MGDKTLIFLVISVFSSLAVALVCGSFDKHMEQETERRAIEAGLVEKPNPQNKYDTIWVKPDEKGECETDLQSQ